MAVVLLELGHQGRGPEGCSGGSEDWQVRDAASGLTALDLSSEHVHAQVTSISYFTSLVSLLRHSRPLLPVDEHDWVQFRP